MAVPCLAGILSVGRSSQRATFRRDLALEFLLGHVGDADGLLELMGREASTVGSGFTRINGWVPTL